MKAFIHICIVNIMNTKKFSMWFASSHLFSVVMQCAWYKNENHSTHKPIKIIKDNTYETPCQQMNRVKKKCFRKAREQLRAS